MTGFPPFIKNEAHKIDSAQQNTDDVEGYYYDREDGSQVAFWECHSDKTSKKHTHDFDEYMICISGEYTAYLNGRKVILKSGDELFIPAGTEQWGMCKAGTRTIHAFAGKRIK